MTRTLLITILIEGLVGLGFAVWRRKPVLSISLTILFGNIITQSLLWIILNIFFNDYLIALVTSEILIWLGESIFLACVRNNQLNFGEAFLLSLVMNLCSFGVGMFLPI